MARNGGKSGGRPATADRERKILGVLLVSLGLLVAIGLVQHRGGDGGDLRRFNRAISCALIGFLGFGAWLVPVAFLRLGWNRLTAGSLRSLLRHLVLFLSLLITFALLVFSAGRLFFHVSAEKLAEVGGGLGSALFGFTDRMFGALGSTLIGVTFLLVVLIALYDISVPRPSAPAGSSVLRRIPGGILRLLRSVGGALAARFHEGRAWIARHREAARAEREAARTEKEAIRAAEEAVLDAEEESVAEEEWADEEGMEEEEEEGDEEEEEPEGETAEEEGGEEGDAPPIVRAEKPRTVKNAVPKKRRAARGEKEYLFPPIGFLGDPPVEEPTVAEAYLRDQSARLEEVLKDFGVRARVTEVHPGPVITRFELEPAPGVKVQQIAGLADDLALALRAKRIRIVAPIPGKGAVGVEIPNPKTRTVYLKEILTSVEYAERSSTLTVALGKDIGGRPFCVSLEEMPHLLIAGATGAGKSVCIHVILTSLLYGAAPEEVHLVLIDPKMLEMAVYNGIPHLLTPVVTDAKEAARVLRWAVFEMERRYKLLARVGVRNILEYNRQLPRLRESQEIKDEGIVLEPLAYLVVVIDEFADLILTAPNEIEDSVARLAQMARAVGIHLVLATQRPSVNVITGVIKANFPSRIAFQVASKIDSRTIIDANGAEKLLGRGDMLFVFSGRPEVSRIHGAFITTEETTEIVTFLKEQGYQPKDKRTVLLDEEGGESGGGLEIDREDEFFDEAARIVIRSGQGSVSLLQRRLRVGYSRAARLVDLLEDAGVVGPFEGSKAREVLVDEEWLRAREGADAEPAETGE
ncbi:MAG: DNA translocase FtsK 4TM domain-containing protein [Candidatus Eisenbacteria bacterium]|nr:DNA translocase FtsK 4TM domain-containing protein [Candidatus Eisenbacteria bacterium]